VQLCKNLEIDSVYLATEWLSLGSRLEALGILEIPTSKWDWQECEDSVTQDTDMKAPPGQTQLLKKRDFDDVVSKRERGFNLDMFDLVRTNYGLTHPSLFGVRKTVRAPVKSVQVEPFLPDFNDRMDNIRKWLDNMTENYNADSYSEEMRKYLKHSSHREERSPQAKSEGRVMVAGESRVIGNCLFIAYKF
jgi:hypothetical protein